MNTSKYLHINNHGWLGWSCIVLLLLLSPVHAAADMTGSDVEVTFSGKFTSTPLVEILTNMSEQTGYAFEVPEGWSAIEVSGEFVQEDLHTFFSRVVKGSNFTLVVDEENRIVAAKDFGGSPTVLHAFKSKKVDEQRDSDTGMLKKNLQALHNKQLTEWREQQASPEAVEPESGLPNKYLRQLHNQQYLERERRIQAGTAIDPESGMLISDLKRLHEQQRANYNDETIIDPESGMLQSDLKHLHEQQMGNQNK